MNWRSFSLNTFIPELPEHLNYNFRVFENYIAGFFDPSKGILIKPLETVGKVKGARGEFVTTVTDNLVVRNQWTNLYDNFTTADNDYYTMISNTAVTPRDPCTYGIDTSTWNFPYEPSMYKVIDVNKPYYKITNEYPLFLANKNLSQVVGVFFTDASLVGGQDFEIVLDPCTGMTYNVDPSSGGQAYMEFIAVSYDPSWGSTWTQYKYGADDSSSGGGGSGTVGPGTIGTIPVFGPTTTTVQDSSLYQVNGVIYGPDISVGDVYIHNAIRDSSENILIGYGSPMQINDPNADRDVSIYGDTYIDGSLFVNGTELSGYNPSLSDSLAVPTTVGGITAGTTVGDLRGKTYEAIINDLLFPTVLASIGVTNSANLSGISGGVQEVGTLLSPSATGTYNNGQITNGDGTAGPDLTGDGNYYTFKLPDGTVDGEYATSGNTQAHSFTGYNITFGGNVWDVSISYDAGSGAYYDNKGNPGTNLDAQRVAGVRTDTSPTVTGRRYAWYGAGGTTPTSSAQVRALGNKVFLSGTNTGTFDISIPSSTANVYFFIPIGKTVVVQYVESSFADVTGSFTTVPITVNDAGGTGQSYESWTTTIGGGGYPGAATYRVTIT